jgi:hypothetical protein
VNRITSEPIPRAGLTRRADRWSRESVALYGAHSSHSLGAMRVTGIVCDSFLESDFDGQHGSAARSRTGHDYRRPQCVDCLTSRRRRSQLRTGGVPLLGLRELRENHRRSASAGREGKTVSRITRIAGANCADAFPFRASSIARYRIVPRVVDPFALYVRREGIVAGHGPIRRSCGWSPRHPRSRCSILRPRDRAGAARGATECYLTVKRDASESRAIRRRCFRLLIRRRSRHDGAGGQ